MPSVRQTCTKFLLLDFPQNSHLIEQPGSNNCEGCFKNHPSHILKLSKINSVVIRVCFEFTFVIYMSCTQGGVSNVGFWV